MSLVSGINSFAGGFSLAKTKAVLPFIFLPASVSLLVISLGIYFGVTYIEEFSLYLQNALPSWLSFLSIILEPILYILGILVSAWSFGFIATFVGAPFLGDLSKAIDRNQDNPPIEDTNSLGRQILKSIGRELRKLRYHLPRLLLLLIVSITPLLNVFAPLLWLGFGAWMLAVQFCDYASENHGHSFEHTLEMLSSHRTTALGFGGCATLAMSIPVLNFLVAPIAVVGGTQLMHQLHTQNSGSAT